MVKLFVEGGGDDDSLKTECRRGFAKLLEKGGLAGRMPRIVACGGRQRAYDRFSTELAARDPATAPMLLVDSEDPVLRGTSPWAHVASRKGDQWAKPAGASDDHLHLMVQCMETWLLADRQAIASFYGNGFRVGALPSAGSQIETLSRQEILQKLEQATRSARTKGRYDKGRHSFALLAQVDPGVLRQASPWADRFFEMLDRKTNLRSGR